jgi:pimeloyl-ACP methyl ester carboxylesterase
LPTSAHTVQPSLLKVPGAQIYYEVQGSGPVLLMIPGGPTDAGIFDALAACLVDQYTVVRYDPRGNSRSVLDGWPEDQDMDVHGDDAAQLIKAMGGESALVLGSSGGVQIGLNLAARHSDQVKTLVAHEPPCMGFLPNPEEQRAFGENVYNTYLTSGAGPPCRSSWPAQGLPEGRALRGQRLHPPRRWRPLAESREMWTSSWPMVSGRLVATFPTLPLCAQARSGSWLASARPQQGACLTARRWRQLSYS